MKLSTTFQKAHDLLASGDERYRYSCDAILAVPRHSTAALLWWRAHFTPREDSPEHYWLRGTDMTDAEKQHWRLTGLLLAAAITKAEGI